MQSTKTKEGIIIDITNTTVDQKLLPAVQMNNSLCIYINTVALLLSDRLMCMFVCSEYRKLDYNNLRNLRQDMLEYLPSTVQNCELYNYNSVLVLCIQVKPFNFII